MAQSAIGGASYESGYMGSAPSVSTAGEYEVYDLGKKAIKKGAKGAQIGRKIAKILLRGLKMI